MKYITMLKYITNTSYRVNKNNKNSTVLNSISFDSYIYYNKQ